MFYNLMAAIQRHCVPVLNLILMPVKGRLHGRTFGTNDSLQGELTFRKWIPHRRLMGIMDRETEPIWSLADSNKQVTNAIEETNPMNLSRIDESDVRQLRLINEKACNQRSWLQAFISYKFRTLSPKWCCSYTTLNSSAEEEYNELGRENTQEHT